ncbi:hypothetical protein NEMIN01_2351 [Nematocida minor]|uniref:uncharacterized protein n=1 Tax=Nematocida minor TaxID=1912983 RepID=UPI002220E095|nr:uncharacterized protein NEMIN01_2351 [Nematocida minor]KAI5193007.1 hypothetical protein NEMIN01_2351 [Nematocida minor]
MPAQTVRLKIDLKGLLRECEALNASGSNILLMDDTPKRNMAIVDYIFKDRNIEIVSGANGAKEEKLVLDIVKNAIREYFVYNEWGESTICSLTSSYNSMYENRLRDKIVPLANQIIDSNMFIFRPEHEIYGHYNKNETVEDIVQRNKSGSLSPRMYTLEIDYTDSSSLERILEATKESLDRGFLGYICSSMNTEIRRMNGNILRKYSLSLSEKEQYSLDELYTRTYEGTNVPLVDYGLKIIYERYQELIGIVENDSRMKSSSSGKSLITARISELFTKEELKIIGSISVNIHKIAQEKELQKNMIYYMEYLANKTALLDRAGEKVLRVTSDLESFKKDYINGYNGLENIVKNNCDLLKKKIADNEEILYPKHLNQRRSMAQGNNGGFRDNPASTSDLLNEVSLLKYALKEENRIRDTISMKASLKINISPVQKKHIIQKMEEFGKAWNIKVEVADPVPERITYPNEYEMKEAVVDRPIRRSPLEAAHRPTERKPLVVDEPTERKFTQKDLFKMLGLGIFIGVGVKTLPQALSTRSANDVMNPAAVENILNCEESSSFCEQPPTKKYREGS